ncbi:Pex24p integral peroxisomal membrane peroxin [Suhomyces tanzawaensis NRRL Y-17324]|uniref:Pex24p integral peroxisomal membrane peroxin n=1 Tax=Suhomyces tanzawaensis NRRL Y-17324 TaxID=984487 RepID=A0A1E4SPE5_9ASCO|nr:Pex24p integral peroxisomal membrane peroxin [Suhomyces tanzawaensis NRRL Y-17324]ODV81358.1 Pex24p integral peroxisomal membrane peroxin [Suhomyces tanzawaensis NRRL Y-17324]
MPDKYEPYILANFEPSDAKQLKLASNSNLLVDFPILASALSQIFPYLLLIDGFLEIVTWTNDDPYQNFLLVVVYSCIVVWWSVLSCVIFPVLITITFACVVWSITSVIYDSKFDEKPTIEEVLYTLHNITIRFEMLLRPVQHIPFKFKNYAKLFFMAVVLTPIHLLLMKTILPPQRFVWITGLFALTYHSPWSFAIRRLLWRSVYIRVFAFYVTGLDIKLSRHRDPVEFKTVSRIQSPTASDDEDLSKVQVLSDFRILKKSVTSPTQLKQVVLFEVLENERRWIGLGWSNHLMPNERSNYCFAKSLSPSPPLLDTSGDDFSFPVFENDIYSYSWSWQDSEWSLDPHFNDNGAPDGWLYYDRSWANPRPTDGFSKYTRSRKWIRKAILLIDKQDTVYDE